LLTISESEGGELKGKGKGGKREAMGAGRNGIGTRSHLVLRRYSSRGGNGLFGVDLTRIGEGKK
jgi:hypothetical protein